MHTWYDLFHKNIFFEYGVRGQALLVVPPSETKEGGEGESQQPDAVVFDGKWSLHRLQSFFSEHALKEAVKPPTPTDKAAEEKDKKAESDKKDRVKTEL